MAVEVTLPKLSDTMEEGTLLRWLKQEGDEVRVGDVIAEVETDKADMELESEHAGTLSEIRVREGEVAAVGAVLAVLGSAAAPERSDGSDRSDRSDRSDGSDGSDGSDKSVGSAATSPKAKPRIVLPPVSSAKAEPPAAEPSAAEPAAAAPPATEPAATAPSAAEPHRSKLRAAVAKQMVASKRDIPHFYVTCEIDMSDAAHLRKALSASRELPERLTYTHMILRALALTLQRHPRLNATWEDDGIVFHDAVHLGFAVAVEDGLIAPVLRDCQNRSLRNLAHAVAEVVEKVQSGRSDKLTGATFTLSNLGMLDIESFSAVIIPPQSAILAVGSIKDRAVVRDGQLAIAKTMRATLSADHRVTTGYEAGRFLEDLKRTLENPVLLVFAEENQA